MAQSSIPNAITLDTDAVLHLSKCYSDTQFQSLQATLTATVQEIRTLTTGNTLAARIGEKLSQEQRQMLNDTATLIESINTQIEHTTEELSRVEKDAERRQQARKAEARRLLLETYPQRGETLEHQLNVIKTVMTFSCAGVLNDEHSPRALRLILSVILSPDYTRQRLGWSSEQAFLKSEVLSLHEGFMQVVESKISTDNGSSVQDRLDRLKQKVADSLSNEQVSAGIEETLRLWSEALSPHVQREGGE